MITVLLFVISLHPLWTGCSLCVQEVSLTNARSPWCSGWRPRGWGSLPAGWGLCFPLTGPCRPPYDLRVPYWGSLLARRVLPARRVGSLLAPYSFPFAVRDVYRCAACTRCNWVLPVPRSLLLFSLLSLGVYRDVFLLSGYVYTQGISPFWKKKGLKLTWNCPRTVQISHESP